MRCTRGICRCRRESERIRCVTVLNSVDIGEVEIMLRIGICDDECYARDALRLELEKILEETEEIVYEFSCGETAVSWLKKHLGEIDLLFLDVEMRGISGIQAAEQIRGFDTKLQIVFVTGYRDFVFQGYRVQAVDYLVKPVDAVRLSDVLDRVRRQLEQAGEKQFVFQNADGVYRLYLDEIQYFYSDKRKVSVVTKERTLSFYAKLDEVEERVGRPFVRIHQRYLVNADAVTYIGASSVRIGDEELPVSRAMKQEAVAAFAKTMIGGEVSW